MESYRLQVTYYKASESGYWHQIDGEPRTRHGQHEAIELGVAQPAEGRVMGQLQYPLPYA